MLWLILATASLFGLAITLLAWSARLKAQSGLPDGEIISSDMSVQSQGKPLYSPRYELTGTPDYIVKTRQGVVPIEVKPGRTEHEPHESHLLQALAYCLLIEESEGKRPPYGLLKYNTDTFKVDYNEQTRAYLLDVLEEMRQAAEGKDVPRNHDQPGRCRACGYRSICDQSLWADK